MTRPTWVGNSIGRGPAISTRGIWTLLTIGLVGGGAAPLPTSSNVSFSTTASAYPTNPEAPPALRPDGSEEGWDVEEAVSPTDRHGDARHGQRTRCGVRRRRSAGKHL